jgi:hypothetical protein|nr:MAG TPA: hypothetical protein [Caudoviricetes sp.]
MKTTKLMRQTANALRVYRIAIKENVNMEIQIYLSSVFDVLLEKMMKQKNIEFHCKAIKILDEMLSNPTNHTTK